MAANTDFWGWCGSCRRWSPLPGWVDSQRPAAACTVCGAEPEITQNLLSGGCRDRIGRARYVADLGDVAA